MRLSKHRPCRRSDQRESRAFRARPAALFLPQSKFLLRSGQDPMAESPYIVSLLICVATEFEASILRDQIGELPRVRLIVTGVGPVNAAHAATVDAGRLPNVHGLMAIPRLTVHALHDSMVQFRRLVLESRGAFAA